jgi:hypothetical protein
MARLVLVACCGRRSGRDEDKGDERPHAVAAVAAKCGYKGRPTARRSSAQASPISSASASIWPRASGARDFLIFRVRAPSAVDRASNNASESLKEPADASFGDCIGGDAEQVIGDVFGQQRVPWFISPSGWCIHCADDADHACEFIWRSPQPVHAAARRRCSRRRCGSRPRAVRQIGFEDVPELLGWLEKIAEAEDRTVSYVIRRFFARPFW